MTADERALVEAAAAARDRAYAPYSRFRVGAALRTADGRVFTGANVENATFGLTVCAERAALVQAVNQGARDFVALAVVTETQPPAAPCGLCRQSLVEFVEDLPIVLVNPAGEVRRARLAALLPEAFTPHDLLRRDG